MKLDNHDVDVRDDRVGESHVVCSGQQGVPNRGRNCGEVGKVWPATGQSYRINGWNLSEENGKGNEMVGCMLNGARSKRARAKVEDGESDDESPEMVCNMTGQSWESLPFPRIIDSGACAPVMPTSWCNHVPLNETLQSWVGDYYRAANGNKIYHEGERVISMMTQECAFRDMKFTSCEVSKALGFVSQMCKTGHIVAFNPPLSNQGFYIEQVSTGERL